MVNTHSTHNSSSPIIGGIGNNNSNNNDNNSNEVEVLNKTRVMCLEVVLRVLGMVLTLVAAIVVGVDTQSKVIQIQPQPNLPLLNLTIHAKWHYLSAFVYFVVVNSIACVYALISLLLSLASGKKGLAMVVITTLDVMIVALLFSATGASATVGIIAYKGNSHVHWNKLCNMFERFCGQLMVGSVFSLIGALVFVLLVLLSLFKYQINN